MTIYFPISHCQRLPWTTPSVIFISGLISNLIVNLNATSDMALNESDLPSAIELDITDYHRQPSAYTQSNEELLAADTHPVPNQDSASENTVNLTDAPIDVSAANPPPIRLELAAIKSSRTTIERVPTICNPSGFTSPGPRNGDEFLQVSTSSRQGVSEDDIELDDFAVTCAGTYSTDNLVPLPSEVAELVDRPQPQNLPYNPGTSDRVDSRTVPNYKPAPLRWPFQVLVVAMVAAMFGFLEYQVHDLPPPRYKALQLDLKEGSDILPAAADRPITTPAIQATPLPKGSAVIATRTHIQTSEDDPYMPDHDSRLKVRKPLKMIPAPTPRPESSEYPSPPALVTAYCGWNRPKWIQDVFIMNRPEWPAISTFSYISEQISMFTTTDPSWCPCTITKGAVFFPASWDTNDEGCRSVFNLISTMNTMDYKNHVWNQPTKALSQPVRMVTEPPSAVAVAWGYPKTNAKGELMLPLEVRTPKFELRDVFGNQLVDRSTTATFPVSYRWLADELALFRFNEDYDDPELWPLSSAYLAGPTAPCVTDITERDLLLYRSLFDFPLDPCPETPERYKTVWWTLPYGRSLSSSTGTMEPVLATPSTVATGTRVNEDGTSDNPAQATTGSKAIGPNSRPLSSTLGVTTIISVEAQPSPSTSADMASIGEPSAATGQDENLDPSTLQVHSISKGTDSEVVTQRPPVPTSSAGANTSFNTKLTQTNRHNSPPGQDIAANGPTGTQETIITKAGKPGAASTTHPNTFLHLDSDETRVKMQTAIVSVFTVTWATGPIAPKETLFTEAEGSGAFSTSFPDSDTTPVKPQTTDISALTWATRDDHTVTAINNNKSGITGLPSPAATSSSTAATSNPPPNNSIRPAWGGPIPPDVQEKFSNLRSEADYLMVSLIPVLLATLLGIPVQIFVASLNSMLPFRALVREHGAHVEQSLHLPRASWLAPLISYRFLARFKDPLPFLAVILETLATMLVPLSTETIRMEFTTMGCRRSKVRLRCAFGLRKVEAPIRVVEAVLVMMAVLVIVMGCLLARWRTGFATEPWSIASMAGLLHGSEKDVHDLLRKIPKHGSDEGKCLLDSEISGPFEGKRYRLGFYTSSNEEPRYGLHVVPAREDDSPVRPTVRDPKMRKPLRPAAAKFKFWHMQPSAREIGTRLITLIFVVGLLVLILYYENTILDTLFERFMDSQSFGVRLLFTSFGAAVSGLWSYHFSQTAESQIYDRLVTPKPARESILLSPPSNVFTGLWRFSRTKDILASNIALAALVAKFTPILFSNIPFRNTVTWKMHETCTWMAVAVLSYMVIVLVGLLVWTSLGERWTRRQRKVDLPVKVDTILGCMYYLVESRMVQDLEGVEMLARTARDRLVGEMGRLYVFVEVEKGDGRRMGVDYAASEARR